MPSPNVKTTKIADSTQDQRLLDVLNTVWDELQALRKQFGDDGTGAKGNLVATKAAFDMPNCAAGSRQATTVACAGAVVGDFCEVSCSLDLQGLVLSAYVNAADTVTIQVTNNTGGAIDLAAADYLVVVYPKRAQTQGVMPAMALSK